jgi:hypothetical protein
MTPNDDYSLVMPFIDQSPSFALGFECGLLYQQMAEGKTIKDEIIHTENREQVEEICRRFRYEYEIGVSVSGWNSFNAKPTGERN